MKRGQHKRQYTPEWERARVERWLEIIIDDPIPKHHGYVGRLKEFEIRYARLEADVPTPVDV